MGVERVSVDSHFFDDLGADSLVMARFCARVRKRPELPSVSMKDIYAHPTIRSLAAALEDIAPSPVESSVPAWIEAARPAGTVQYVVCGALQFLFFLGYAYFAVLVGALGYEWISAGSGAADIYLRSALFSGSAFVVVCTLPILAKWLLIGRWKPQQIRIWSLAYVRFWIVKTLVRSNPMALLFVGSPLYVLYLRALGAKIGPGVVIFSRHVPVCTDLLTIGANTVIRKESFFFCYRARRRSDRDRSGDPRAATCSSVRRPCSTSTPRWAMGRSSVTPPRCTPARPCPTASGGMGRRRSALR